MKGILDQLKYGTVSFDNTLHLSGVLGALQNRSVNCNNVMEVWIPL